MFTPHLQRFRWYGTGTETGATPLAAEDININPNVDSDFQCQYRILVEETANADGGTGDDWRFTYNKNGAGENTLTTTDSGDGIRAIAAGLSDQGATTDRATGISNPGGGSFVAGLQIADGLGDDMQLTANNFTEHVAGIEIIASNVVDTDFFDIALDRPNSLVINITGRLTVAKAGAAPVIPQIPRRQFTIQHG